MLCQLDEAGLCRRCKRAAAAPGVIRECSKPGLGDRAAALLARLGISKERVSRIIGRDCGCGRRQAWLNRWGWWAWSIVTRGRA